MLAKRKRYHAPLCVIQIQCAAQVGHESLVIVVYNANVCLLINKCRSSFVIFVVIVLCVASGSLLLLLFGEQRLVIGIKDIVVFVCRLFPLCRRRRTRWRRRTTVIQKRRDLGSPRQSRTTHGSIPCRA